MSDYEQFLQEREQMDILLEKGYKIAKVTENLDGAFVDFAKRDAKEEEAEMETVHLSSANARKYFAVKLIEQQAVNFAK